MLSETKMRFIQNVIDEEIIIYKQSKDVIIDRLRELEYPFYENNDIFGDILQFHEFGAGPVIEVIKNRKKIIVRRLSSI